MPWNWATEVAGWQVLAGSDPRSLRTVATTPWNGLDTQVTAHTDGPYVEVVAPDDRGRPIGRSQAVRVSD